MKISQWWLVLAGTMTQALSAATLPCIDGGVTAQSVDQWRRKATEVMGEDMSDRSIADAIDQCFGNQVPACLQRLNDYSKRNDLASPSLDVAVPASPQKQPPQELFLDGADTFAWRLPEDVEARAAQHGWPAVRYKSRHSGGFDSDTPSLLMIMVPGDKVNPPVAYDRWINIALPADQGSEAMNPTPQAALPSADDYAAEGRGEMKLPRIFTMVSLDRRNGNTPGQVYFQKFVRGQSGNATFKADVNANLKQCVNCHPNGLRAISPLGYHTRKDEASMNDTDWQTVKVINDAMVQAAGSRTVVWRDVLSGGVKKSLLNPAAFGPSVGPVAPLNGQSRTAAFIAQCAEDRRVVEVRDIFGRAPGRNNVYRMSAAPQIDASKIIRYMNCGGCHGTAQRAPLNKMTDFDQIDFKILVDQSMPLGAHRNPLESSSGQVQDQLSSDERIALANCLRAEFTLESKQLTAWLTQNECR